MYSEGDLGMLFKISGVFPELRRVRK